MSDSRVSYNAPLRSYVLISSIRAEEAASDAVKSMLRTVKSDSKTLSNKSSSLSFKNKIDLLYDIDDLDKQDYTRCLKFMEIRNQFIHNPKCNYFSDLETESPESFKYLKTLSTGPEQDEKKMLGSFNQLGVHVIGKLLALKLEYDEGQTNEMVRFVNSKIMDKFDEVYSAAFKKWQKSNPINTPLSNYFTSNRETNFSSFEGFLKIELLECKIQVLDSISDGKFTEKEVFERREHIMNELKRRVESQGHKEQI